MERGAVPDKVLSSVIADATATTYINEARRSLKQDQKRVRNPSSAKDIAKMVGARGFKLAALGQISIQTVKPIPRAGRQAPLRQV